MSKLKYNNYKIKMFRKRAQNVRKVNELPISLVERNKSCRSVALACHDGNSVLFQHYFAHIHILSACVSE